MSQLVGPDGKTPLRTHFEEKKYLAGGLRFTTALTPDALLTKALNSAKQMIAAQAHAKKHQESMSRVGNKAVADAEAEAAAQTAASSIGDPFTLEPAAMAVFMYLSREIEYRDLVIEQLNERLTQLGVEPLDVEHPYPEREPVNSSEEDPEETLPDASLEESESEAEESDD